MLWWMFSAARLALAAPTTPAPCTWDAAEPCYLQIGGVTWPPSWMAGRTWEKQGFEDPPSQTIDFISPGASSPGRLAEPRAEPPAEQSDCSLTLLHFLGAHHTLKDPQTGRGILEVGDLSLQRSSQGMWIPFPSSD